MQLTPAKVLISFSSFSVPSWFPRPRVVSPVRDAASIHCSKSNSFTEQRRTHPGQYKLTKSVMPGTKHYWTRTVETFSSASAHFSGDVLLGDLHGDTAGEMSDAGMRSDHDSGAVSPRPETAAASTTGKLPVVKTITARNTYHASSGYSEQGNAFQYALFEVCHGRKLL